MSTSQYPEYFTLEQYSQRVSLSVSTLRRRIGEGEIPSWQPGGPGTRILIPADSLLRPSDSAFECKKLSGSLVKSEDKRTVPGPVPKWKQNLSTTQSNSNSEEEVNNS